MGWLYMRSLEGHATPKAYLGSPQGLCAKARLEAQSMNIDYAAR